MASIMQKRKKPKKETPEEARQRYLREIMRREMEDKKRVEREMHNLVKQINALILKDRKSLVVYQRKFKNEDPRSVFYYRMLRRVGLPEVHARFAPWFLKSNQIELNRWSAVLFDRLEQAFFAIPEQLSTVETRMLGHQKHYDAIMKLPPADVPAPDTSKVLEPRQKNQLLLQRAFRDCSFHVDEDIARKRQQQVAIKGVKMTHKIQSNQASDNQEDEVDKLEMIPEVPVLNAPPGLAPQVRGQLESHGRHTFFTYNGRWKDGEMHGVLGVYAFADGGKYRGEFVHSVPSGNGTVVYPNGVKYTGAFAEGKFHGFGVMETERGYRYEGDFQHGQRNGKGKLHMLQSGAVYDGEFYNNMRHGQGTETSALGYSYVGTWRCNRICGKGRLFCPDKREVFRTDWPPLLLGEAIRLVKREKTETSWNQELWYRKLLRVRDDLRALDLQYAFWDAEEARMEREVAERIDNMKRVRREKREAQAAAKKAFMEQVQREVEGNSNEGSDVGSGGDDDGDDDEDGSGESDDDAESSDEEEDGEPNESEEEEED
ncbi:MORN repeat-containing protein 1 [Phytophthora citrophthora]|uniref:MORN repeat-containing protein 1 n=1 Tax=Phytophthora citrophthora TaxID=4793 RepID=A0AAD9GUC2_9STRA|nr:MORN repeat-containing protein 1 [Phytophthora citrophthora]